MAENDARELPGEALAQNNAVELPGEALAQNDAVELPGEALAQNDAVELPGEALAHALATVGDRWTLLVVAALLDGARRFGELQQDVSGIAPNVLTQRLRALERDALVVARPYSERPPRFVYELTTAGRELGGVLRLLAGWGARNDADATAPRHATCGTPMEARWWCPTCERAVPDDESEGEGLHFV